MLDVTKPSTFIPARTGKRRFFDDVNITLGASIRVARRTRKMSREEFAGKIGVSQQQVRKYETGENRVSVPRLMQISDVLGITMMRLLASAMGTREAGEIAPELQLSAQSEPARRLLDVARKLHTSGRTEALADLADLAEHLVRE